MVGIFFYQNCNYMKQNVAFFPQDCVKTLLKNSADVNARDKNWQTPLHIAAANNHINCASKYSML